MLLLLLLLLDAVGSTERVVGGGVAPLLVLIDARALHGLRKVTTTYKILVLMLVRALLSTHVLG